MGKRQLSREEQSKRDKARLARRRQAAQREFEARKATMPPPEFHNCAVCGTKIRVEFKRCRRCAGIRVRPDVDAIERRLPGSFESNAR
jgi:hypothetical protein